VQRSPLSLAATVTMVTGSAVEDVLRASGAGPAHSESLRRLADDAIGRLSADPRVAVTDHAHPSGLRQFTIFATESYICGMIPVWLW
jgi:hypothetical protein